MENIFYKGVIYNLRYVLIHEGKEYDLIGPARLRDVILEDDDGYLEYSDEMARKIDEIIYAFVDDDIFDNYTDEELEKYVNENFN